MHVQYIYFNVYTYVYVWYISINAYGKIIWHNKKKETQKKKIAKRHRKLWADLAALDGQIGKRYLRKLKRITNKK